MGQVTIVIDKREYSIACDDGQEAHIIKLSRILDDKARQLSSRLGLINENLMLAMVGLLIADELEDIKAGVPVGIAAEDVRKSDTDVAGQIDAQTNRITQLIQDLKSV